MGCLRWASSRGETALLRKGGIEWGHGVVGGGGHGWGRGDSFLLVGYTALIQEAVERLDGPTA